MSTSVSPRIIVRETAERITRRTLLSFDLAKLIELISVISMLSSAAPNVFRMRYLLYVLGCSIINVVFVDFEIRG